MYTEISVVGDEAFCYGLTRAIAETPGLKEVQVKRLSEKDVLSDAYTGGPLVARVRSGTPEGMGVDMKGAEKLLAARLSEEDQIAHRWNQIFVLDEKANRTMQLVLIGCGARHLAYMTSPETILDAIKPVMNASRDECPSIRTARKTLTNIVSSPKMNQFIRDTPLTQREREVWSAMGEGLTNKGIAFYLGISYETVKEHVQHILRKLGVSDRTQAAVIYARKVG